MGSAGIRGSAARYSRHAGWCRPTAKEDRFNGCAVHRCPAGQAGAGGLHGITDSHPAEYEGYPRNVKARLSV